MNDRYLFKAKRIDNGEWVTGSYVYTFAPDKECPVIGLMKENHFIVEENGNMCIIDKSTLCQCTGLKDKNGTLIWENALVLTPREDGYSLICWNDTEARWEMHNETEGIVLDFDNYWANEIEVVGNKFDNPELLEVE